MELETGITWKELLYEMLDTFERDFAYDHWTNIWRLVDQDHLLMVAQELEDALGEAKIKQFLTSVFDRGGLQQSRLHALLPAISWRAILTTN